MYTLFFIYTLKPGKETTKGRYHFLGWGEEIFLHWLEVEEGSCSNSRLFFRPVISLQANICAPCHSAVKTVSLSTALAGAAGRRASDINEMLLSLLSQVCRLLSSKPADVIQSRKKTLPLCVCSLTLMGSSACLRGSGTEWTGCNLQNFGKSHWLRQHTPKPARKRTGVEMLVSTGLGCLKFCFWVLAPPAKADPSGKLDPLGTGLLCLTDASCLLRLSAFFLG